MQNLLQGYQVENWLQMYPDFFNMTVWPPLRQNKSGTQALVEPGPPAVTFTLVGTMTPYGDFL